MFANIFALGSEPSRDAQPKKRPRKAPITLKGTVALDMKGYVSIVQTEAATCIHVALLVIVVIAEPVSH